MARGFSTEGIALSDDLMFRVMVVAESQRMSPDDVIVALLHSLLDDLDVMELVHLLDGGADDR